MLDPHFKRQEHAALFGPQGGRPGHSNGPTVAAHTVPDALATRAMRGATGETRGSAAAANGEGLRVLALNLAVMMRGLMIFIIRKV